MDDRPCAARHRPLLALLALALAAALPGTALALHEPLVAVSLKDGVSVSAPAVQETLRDALGADDRQAAPARTQAAETDPAPLTPQEDPAAEGAWMPWMLAAALALCALLAILLVAALVAARRRGRAAQARRKADALRQELDLARLCSEAAIQRSARLAALNADLRRELAALKENGAPGPAHGPSPA